tara:strand:+ start:2653 stop:2868 length:216 start_codon:yes stop_codon:yes gene_type:complete
MPRDLDKPLGPNEFDKLEEAISKGRKLEEAINKSTRAGIDPGDRLERAREARRKAEAIKREYFPDGNRPIE